MVDYSVSCPDKICFTIFNKHIQADMPKKNSEDAEFDQGLHCLPLSLNTSLSIGHVKILGMKRPT